MKTTQELLHEHDQAVANIYLADVAISSLDQMVGAAHVTVLRCTKLLQKQQQRDLKIADATAAKLSAPTTPAKTERSDAALKRRTAAQTKGTAKCECGHIRSASKLMKGFAQNGKETWFCEECLPL
jgi:hypothetical protein